MRIKYGSLKPRVERRLRAVGDRGITLGDLCSALKAKSSQTVEYHLKRMLCAGQAEKIGSSWRLTVPKADEESKGVSNA